MADETPITDSTVAEQPAAVCPAAAQAPAAPVVSEKARATYIAHNQHDAEGNVTVPFSSRCACPVCCSVDGITTDRAQQMQSAKTRNL